MLSISHETVVELVAHHVEQQAVVGRHLFDEMHGVRLVEFQHAMSASSLPESETSASSDETTPRVKFEPVGLVNTFNLIERLQHAGHHACGGGFAVRAGDRHHAETAVANVRDGNCRSMRSTILPGNALPPP